MKIHSHILQGHEATEENAREHAQGYDFSQDEEPQEHKFDWQHHQYIETVRNIDIYYNSTADYYFFYRSIKHRSDPNQPEPTRKQAIIN